METLLLSTVLPALIPAASDLVRGLVGTVTGNKGAQPQNIDEVIKLGEFDLKKVDKEIDRVRALAEIDKPAENISPWVADLRGSFRYIASGIAVLQPFAVLPFCHDIYVMESSLNIAGMAFGFIFGERMYFGLKGIQK